MASEGALRGMVATRVKQYDPDAHVRQVENAAGAGDPDTYVCSKGRSVWLELKYMPRPKRATTALRGRHIRTSQLLWAADHLKAGGNVWFLVQVGRDYYLLTPAVAAALKHGLAPEELDRRASVIYRGHLPPDMMEDALAGA